MSATTPEHATAQPDAAVLARYEAQQARIRQALEVSRKISIGTVITAATLIFGMGWWAAELTGRIQALEDKYETAVSGMAEAGTVQGATLTRLKGNQRVLRAASNQVLLALDQFVIVGLAGAEAGQAEKLQAVIETAKDELKAFERLE